MQYQGTQTFSAPVDVIWPKLLDPAVLQQCIAGCETFEQVSDASYHSTVKVSMGPVTARFVSKMELTEVVAPQRCTLKFSGQGGVAGFGKGEARVTLTPIETGGTQLDWVADAQVGGKLAQMGSRLIEGTVRKMREDFFARFAEVVAPPPPQEPPVAPVSEPDALGSATPPVRAHGAGATDTGWALWAGAVALALAALGWMAGLIR